MGPDRVAGLGVAATTAVRSAANATVLTFVGDVEGRDGFSGESVIWRSLSVLKRCRFRVS